MSASRNRRGAAPQVRTAEQMKQAFHAPLKLKRSIQIILTDANEFMSQYHNRMPVLLGPDQYAAWREGLAGTEALAAQNYLRAKAVSPKVNSVDNQGAELVLPDL
jgi:putative SOS response-associated peptidase YedK